MGQRRARRRTGRGAGRARRGLLVLVVGAHALVGAPAPPVAAAVAPTAWGSTTDDGCFVVGAHRTFADRVPTRDEVRWWLGSLVGGGSRAGVVQSLLRGDAWLHPEVTRLYEEALDRAPEVSDLAYWSDLVRDGMSLSKVASFVYGSPELRSSGPDDAAYVTELYRRLLHREPDPSEIPFWVGQLEQRGAHRVAASFLGTPESRRTRAARLVLGLLAREAGAADAPYAEALRTTDDLGLARLIGISDELDQRLDAACELPAIALGAFAGAVPRGKVGDPFSARLVAFGGTGPYTWSTTGAPPGVAVAGEALAGTPTQPGTYRVRATATDARGATATVEVTVAVDPAAAPRRPGDDLLWYAPDTDAEYLWTSARNGTYRSTPLLAPSGATAITGRFDRSGGPDVLWYGPGGAPDQLWLASGSGYRHVRVSIAGSYVPVPLDANGDGIDDILWYSPAAGGDTIWMARGDGTFRSRPARVDGLFVPVVVDLDGDGADDVFWYGPGSAPDRIWRNRGDGTFATVSTAVWGSYTPVALDAGGDGRTDILWYAAGTGADHLWTSRGDGSWRSTPLRINGRYQPVVLDHDGDGRGDVLWYGAGGAADSLWHSTGTGFRSLGLRIDGRGLPVVVDHDANGRDDLFLYVPGSGADTLYLSRGDGSFTARGRSVNGFYHPLSVDVGTGTGRRPAATVYRSPPAEPGFPWFSGVELRDLFNALEPLPGTAFPAVAPITGHGGADARIRLLAERRGYRLRAVATGGLVGYGSVTLRPDAAEAVRQMTAAARAAGHVMTVSYGFRSVDLQRRLFLRRIPYSNGAIAAGWADGAIEAALRWVAPPGYSRHHSGYVVDLRDRSGRAFGSTGSARWLEADNFANAKRFGFIPSYPAGAGRQGPDPEPWEYAYVGTDAIRCAGWTTRLVDTRAYWTCPAGP